MSDAESEYPGLESEPHSLLESLLGDSITKDGNLSGYVPNEEDSVLEDGDDAEAEAARREELRKQWDAPAASLEEISTAELGSVVLSDAEILARAVCTPDESAVTNRPPMSAMSAESTFVDPVDLTKRYRAQRKICRVWRRYSHIRVFAYFKQLIGFKNHGHPVALLRCVCPQEAALVADPSSGMFVRFRLAGEKFPPMIVCVAPFHHSIFVTSCPGTSCSPACRCRTLALSPRATTPRSRPFPLLRCTTITRRTTSLKRASPPFLHFTLQPPVSCTSFCSPPFPALHFANADCAPQIL